MKALDQMKKAKSFKDFHQKTINEHPRTVASIWQWIVDKRETLSPKQIVEYILEEPVTTVTKQEDDKLRKLGADAKKKNKDGYLSASERYKQAGIKITLLEQSPKGYYDNK
jgi:ABC-type dipeptide/oligopeptide/nickel transport system ATPase subunit